MRTTRALEIVGRVLFSGGALLLLFAAYQLWGTGLAEARSQDRLQKDFAAKLDPAVTTTSSRPPVTQPGDTAPPTAAPQGPPSTPTGAAIAIIRIPSLGVTKAVVEGVSVSDLKKGPGHYPKTPLPGQKGNAAIAGHRTTYGAPFGNIDALKAGDRILVTTRDGEFQYDVQGQKIVRPDEGASVLASTEDSILTLTTCHPKYSAAKRLIVTAKLVGAPANGPPATSATTPPPVSPTIPQTPTTAASTTAAPTSVAPTTAAPTTVTPSSLVTAASFEGEDTKGSAKFPAFAWGLFAAAIYAVMKFAAAKWRRVTANVIGYPVLLVVLFIFFENFSRLLPSNV